MIRSRRSSHRFQGLAATLLLLLLVIGFPFLLIAIGAAPWDADVTQLRTLLTSRDDGTLALVVFAVVAWIAWAVVAVSVVLAVAAELRGLPAPPIPGFALPQKAAAQLVAVAALLFVAAPTVLAAFPTPPAHAAAAAPVLESPPPKEAAVTAPVPVLASSGAVAETPRKHEQATIDYTVKRGDSLWKIAERLLGDGTRYTEIVDLNKGVLNGRPDFIISGTVLKVPHEVTEPVEPSVDGRSDEEYVVKPGDTLSEIAEDELGDPTLYPEIFEASRSTVQPDGAHLSDPNLIRPGWELTIPKAAPTDTGPIEPHHADPPADVTPPVDRPTEPPVEPPTSTATPEPAAKPSPDTSSVDNVDDAEQEGSPGWLLPGLTGAGAILAGGVLLAVRAHRRTQLRYRRPGQTIAPPPAELAAVEKTTFVSDAPVTDCIQQLDRALRTLAVTVESEGRALPVLETLTLGRGTATLHLGEDTDPPSPWDGEGRDWSMRLDESIPYVDAIAPYPLLVTVGQDNAGRLHLVNLEWLGSVTLTGDPDAATALARHVAAEVALNPWSLLVEVDAIGVGEELAALDVVRLRHHAADVEVVDPIATELRAADQAGLGDPDPYRVVITTSTADATSVAEALSSASSRLGAAVVAIDPSPVPGSTAFELTQDGRLHVDRLGLDLAGAGLTSEEASACAAIVDLTRESPTVNMPTFTQAADGWRSLTDQAGALRKELTDMREDGPAGDGSLLPNPAEDYTEVAATTAEDVEALAPVVRAQARRTIEETDPTLDEDVAAWFSDDCPFPRLTLLGPVTATARGTIVPAIMKRKPYFVELLAYLALHPEGATGPAVADAFSISSSRARTDLGYLREWLGANPRTSLPHLPAAAKSRAYKQTGVKTYQVEDVLVDVDLFRRLRARGEARGADGMADLQTAMRLVDGMPFDHLRERGWSWLLDSDRLHETIGCAIVDTAHVVVIDGLSKSDLDTARTAAETACRAVPYDDICRLDLVKIAAAESHEPAADQMLTDDVFNRTDDHLPPIDLPTRTGEVVGKQGWSSARRPSKR